MLIRESCYQRWREIGAPHARALAIATGSRVPMPRVAAAAVVEQTSSAESLDLEPPKETAQEGDSLCQGPKGQKLVKLKRGQLYRMRKRVIQQAVKQTSSIRRQNLMEDLEHGVGMGSNSTAASSSAVEDAKPKAKAKANAKAVAASGEQKEEEKQPQQEGSCAGATPIYAGKIPQKDVRAVLAHCDFEATSIRHFRELLEQHMGLAMGALAAEKNMGRLRKLLEKLVPGQEAGVASETTDKGRPQKKNTTELQCAKEYRTVLCQVLMGSMRGTSQHARPTGSHVVPEEETTSRSEGIEKTPWEHGKDPRGGTTACGVPGKGGQCGPDYGPICPICRTNRKGTGPSGNG